jgi:hypothetical protein
VPDPKLRKKMQEEEFEEPEKILIVDQGGSMRTIDLVEEVKILKREHSL